MKLMSVGTKFEGMSHEWRAGYYCTFGEACAYKNSHLVLAAYKNAFGRVGWHARLNRLRRHKNVANLLLSYEDTWKGEFAVAEPFYVSLEQTHTGGDAKLAVVGLVITPVMYFERRLTVFRPPAKQLG